MSGRRERERGRERRRERVERDGACLPTLAWTGAGDRQDRIMKTDGSHTLGERRERGAWG